MTEMTALVRAAYQQLADLGFRYWGTWQEEDDTRDRCSEGHCLVAEEEGRIVGTITVKESKGGDPDWYKRENVWVISQFAVNPELQRSGLGSTLLSEAEQYAFHQGATEVALDTAEGATHLIDYYQKRGYRMVGKVDWGGTNYVSDIMSKRIRPRLETRRLVLRELTEADFPIVNDYWNDERFRSFYPPGRKHSEECRETFDAAISALQQFPRKGCFWAITREDQTIGRLRLEVSRSNVGQLGYELHADHWGNGFMTEAVREATRYAFEELRVHKLEAWVFANNLASQSILKKLGFIYEGTLREHVAWGDSRMDDLMLGLLGEEWRMSDSLSSISLRNNGGEG